MNEGGMRVRLPIVVYLRRNVTYSTSLHFRIKYCTSPTTCDRHLELLINEDICTHNIYEARKKVLLETKVQFGQTD